MLETSGDFSPILPDKSFGCGASLSDVLYEFHEFHLLAMLVLLLAAMQVALTDGTTQVALTNGTTFGSAERGGATRLRDVGKRVAQIPAPVGSNAVCRAKSSS